MEKRDPWAHRVSSFFPFAAEMIVTMEPKKSGEPMGHTGKDSGEDDDEEKDPKQHIPPPERLLLPIQCPLVDEFVGDIKENLATSNM